ncbi:MAG TPA: nitrous oxide reductase accessory protein NosL [Desulfomonilaceae bacterium]|nr:nitrous oxide reductase accessory protein NosL [Desulfomonilaceae bacterium]
MSFDPRNLLCGLLVLVAALFLAGNAVANIVDLPDGSKLDTSAECPVCHMKADHGTPGPAAAVFKDGKVVGFDGAGDMFRYVLDPAKYEFDPANIKNLYVTDYTTKKFIEAKSALFVLDSDVQASMGSEVVPFTKKEDAEKFKAEHNGTKVVAYSEVTQEALKPKKRMLKMKPDEGHGSGMKH